MENVFIQKKLPYQHENCEWNKLFSKDSTEFVILGEREYPLNKSKSKFVSVGLVYECGFAPGIKLSGTNSIIFDEFEWSNFLKYQGVISNYFHSKKFHIYFEISSTKVVQLWKNNSENRSLTDQELAKQTLERFKSSDAFIGEKIATLGVATIMKARN